MKDAAYFHCLGVFCMLEEMARRSSCRLVRDFMSTQVITIAEDAP